MRSPVLNWSLPGKTCSQMPPLPWCKTGSERSRAGMEIFSPFSRSRMERPCDRADTALRICCLKRRMKRWRFTALLFLLSKRDR
jgi:hypothetical protein